MPKNRKTQKELNGESHKSDNQTPRHHHKTAKPPLIKDGLRFVSFNYALLNYARPLLKEIQKNTELLDNIIDFAKLCWNISVMDEHEQKNILDSLKTTDAIGQKDLKIIKLMIERHHLMFPNTTDDDENYIGQKVIDDFNPEDSEYFDERSIKLKDTISAPDEDEQPVIDDLLKLEKNIILKGAE